MPERESIRPECCRTRKEKLILVKEKQANISFKNSTQKEIQEIQVDGCQITEGPRCDKLLWTEDKEIFIELKGRDWETAQKQLEASLIRLRGHKTRSHAYIISRHHPASDTIKQKIRKRLGTQYHTTLDFVKPGKTFDIETLKEAKAK